MVWRSADLVTPDQAVQILDLYVDDSGRTVSGGRLVTVLSTMGAILFALGVILLVAFNWQEMPKAAKITLLILVTLCAYGAGYWFRYSKDYGRVGLALILLGALLYGAAIHLVAQTYHFPVNHPNLMLLWFLGILPLAYITRSTELTKLGLIIFLLALGFRLPDWLGSNDTEFSTQLVVSGFALFGIVGLALNSLGRLQALSTQTRLFSNDYRAIGFLVTIAVIYAFSFNFYHDGWDFYSGRDFSAIRTGYWAAMSVAGALTLVSAIPAIRQLASGRIDLINVLEGIGPILLLVPITLMVTLPPSSETSALAYLIPFNLLFFAATTGLLIVGYARRLEVLINVAVGSFIIGVITRYFEHAFFDPFLGFIGFGLLFLIGGFLLERFRRRMLKNMWQGTTGA